MNRINSLMDRLADGETFYHSISPKMTRAELDEIESSLGCRMQTSYEDDRRHTVIYPLDIEEFKAKLIKFREAR